MLKKGVVALLLVTLAAMMAVFLLVGWQSRILLSVYRYQAAADVLAVTYHGESKIYDIVAKFLGEFPDAFHFDFETPWEDLGDGTKLMVSGKKEGEVETLRVVAKRAFATSEFEVARQKQAESTLLTDAEIIFALDCTGSMGEAACTDASCSAKVGFWPRVTRMDKLKEAVTGFLDKLETLPGRENVRVGLEVFTLKSDWMYTNYAAEGTPVGEAINPDGDVSVDTVEMKAAIASFLGRSGEQESPACKKILTWTNVGGGLVFAHDYLRGTKPRGRKQIEILVTDGLPNQRTAYSGCRQNVFCPRLSEYCCPGGARCSATGWTCPAGSGFMCQLHGWEFTACAVADTGSQWQPLTFSSSPLPYGVRDPDVDLYAVTVWDSPSPYISQVFDNLATKHYTSPTADQLPLILNTIFEEIVKSFTVININRVVPTVVR